MEQINCFSVDVEDGISIAMRDAFGKKIPQTERVVTNTHKILDLLDKRNCKGTFFVLGQVAAVFPHLVKEINERGHELGVHGYDHWEFYKMTPKKAFEEISRAKKSIEDISGYKVYGHRAPAFSISPNTKWGLEAIAKAGFVYDSSIMPCSNFKHGWSDFPKDLVKIKMKSMGELIEAPMSVDNLFVKEMPVCGGTYLRLLPKSITNISFKRVNRKRPVIIYMHPYEIDELRYPDYYFEELRKTTWQKRLKMKSFWINRDTVYDKLDFLLAKYPFDTLINIINSKKSNLASFEL